MANRLDWVVTPSSAFPFASVSSIAPSVRRWIIRSTPWGAGGGDGTVTADGHHVGDSLPRSVECGNSPPVRRSRMHPAALLLSLAGLGYGPTRTPPPKPMTRTYYIAADTVRWDYVPGGMDQLSGHVYQDTAFFPDSAPRAMSTQYPKILYREYTDGMFRTLKTRSPEWRHLGFLGPLI